MSEIQIRFQGTDRLVASLESMPSWIRAGLAAKIVELTAELKGLVRENLSGIVLKAGSPARLRDSVQSLVVDEADNIRGKVFSTGVPYARIHEYGGRTGPHPIDPVRAKVLAFMSPGQPLALGKEMVFAKHVEHPGSRIPERSYMRRALAQMRPQIIAELKGAAAGAAAAKMVA